MHRTIPTRLREFSAWMRGPGRDEPMRSHPMLAALLDEAAAELEAAHAKTSSFEPEEN